MKEFNVFDNISAQYDIRRKGKKQGGWGRYLALCSILILQTFLHNKSSPPKRICIIML